VNKGKTVERVRSRNTVLSAPGKSRKKIGLKESENKGRRRKMSRFKNTPQTVGITRVEGDRR
jgi:hypothetical protein